MGTPLARIFALCLVLSGVATSRADDKEVPRVEPSSSAPGGKVLEWTSGEGKPYWYRLPKRMRAARPPALIVMLHGTGVPYQWAFWNYPLAKGTWRPSDIVVAPEGMTPDGDEGFNFVQGQRDGKHIADLIRYFKDRLPVGPVYVYGHGQGAIFSYWLAGEHPDAIDGIIAHAGDVPSVRHPPLAKEKVAVGILHGKVDAVVPVESAYRSERVYRKYGYSKVKLEIVDGLEDGTGHWALPDQVDAMMAWLDRVATPDPALCLEIAIAEFGKKRVELAIVAEVLARGTMLAKKLTGDDRAALEARFARFENWMQGFARLHADALLADWDAGRGKFSSDAASEHFRRAERAFGALPAWDEAMKVQRGVAKEQARIMEKVLAELERPSKSIAEELTSFLWTGPIAARYEEVAASAARYLESPPKGARCETVSRLESWLEYSRRLNEPGEVAYFQLNATAAQRLRDADPELLRPLEAEAAASD